MSHCMNHESFQQGKSRLESTNIMPHSFTRDVDAIAKRQAADSKVLEGVASKQADAGKTVDKMADTVEDTHQRLLEVKDYSKDTLDELEHILEKVRRVVRSKIDQSSFKPGSRS